MGFVFITVALVLAAAGIAFGLSNREKSVALEEDIKTLREQVKRESDRAANLERQLSIEITKLREAHRVELREQQQATHIAEVKAEERKHVLDALLERTRQTP